MTEVILESVILARYQDAAERKQTELRHRRGTLVRLHRGAYLDTSLWNRLDAGAQHRARAVAVAARWGSEVVFSHLTAAALWRLPHFGEWPVKPHIAGPSGASETTAAFVRHGLGIGEAVDIDGLLVTDIATTVVNVAATLSFASAVVIADAALRRVSHPAPRLPAVAVTRQELREKAQLVSATHGARKVQRVIDFCDARADRPGESVSRVSMEVSGVTPPQLQVTLPGASGTLYTVDFWWEEFNVIGEFDGKYKYTDPAYMSGRSPQQVLYDEKRREDDLRAAAHGFTRWPWATAISPTLLRSHLARAGIH